MGDSFAFHPPNLSPLRFNPPHPGQHQQDAYRPGSSSGAPPGGSGGMGPAASGAYAATLPSVEEQPGTLAAGGADAAGRPTLVGFDELTGEDLNAPGSSHGLGGGAVGAFGSAAGGETGSVNGYGAAGGPAGSGIVGSSGAGASFRDSFARPLSPNSAAVSSAPYGGTVPTFSSSHTFFNPQTVHPSVNTRNTRPMTAPSGQFYNAYSAAPSGFYAPAPSAYHGSTAYDGMQFSHSGSTAPTSSFQYQVDAGAAESYEAYRARGFSLPDVNGSLDPPSSAGGADDSSPTGTTPFFYTPPAVQNHPQQPLAPHQPHSVYTARPLTAGAAYPTVFDPGMSGTFPGAGGAQGVHPLLPGGPPPPTAMLPPGATLLEPLSSNPPSSSSGPPSLNNSRRPSGETGKHLNFVPQAGQATKRPRRRYDEIERLYGCDYPGCTKAYGTLNHLNSHKTMQKHGPKSTPAQFKEMRKAWRERKKAEAATAARARAAAGPSPTDLLPAPGLPPAFTVPSADGRPRPSTSAGEYHISLAAPTYLTLAGAAGYPVPAQPQGLAPSGGGGGTFIDAQGATWTTSFPGVGGAAGYGPPDAAHPYGSAGGAGGAGGALRPVTAPSYYVAPAFGAHQHQQPQPPTGLLYGYASRVNGQAGGPGSTSNLGAAASADRRFSLPSTTLAPPPLLHTASAPSGPGEAGGVGLGQSPEMKMPQPLLGYQSSQHAALIGAGEGGRKTSGGGDGLASLGLTTGGGGAAKLVLGGGGAEGGAADGAYDA
ncbi:hypothetical protein JCM11251_006035 [Rhodosporidiobolus azoricus]